MIRAFFLTKLHIKFEFSPCLFVYSYKRKKDIFIFCNVLLFYTANFHALGSIAERFERC